MSSHGGKREGSGRDRKFKSETEPVSVRVPVSKKEDFKKKAKELILDEYIKQGL